MNKKKLILAFVVFIFSLVFIMAGSYFYIQHTINEPYNLSSDTRREFTIKNGDSVQQIAANLQSKNFISNMSLFKFHIWQKEMASKLQAGNYELSTLMSISEIANLFATGEIKDSEVSVTIPEGFSNKEIDSRLAENGLTEKGEFLNFDEAVNLDLLKYEFLQDKPEEAGLHGYYFPDTYKYYKNSSIEDIAKKMLDNFGNKLSSDLREEINRQNRTVYEVVVLASIIEKEAGHVEDMKKISSVFHNRLEIGKALESDATINYVVGKGRPQATYEDLQIDSPYNTYKYPGLPPTPISNPGLEAIKASIYPEETNYMFFLTSRDGKAFFSKTYKEHLINKSKYLN